MVGIPAADGDVRCCVDCEVSAVELASSVVDVTNEYITVARIKINSILLSQEFTEFHGFCSTYTNKSMPGKFARFFLEQFQPIHVTDPLVIVQQPNPKSKLPLERPMSLLLANI